MTCIVALSYKDKVYMGGDSSAVEENGGMISTRKEPKVFIKNNYLLGYSGSFRFGKVVEHLFVPPRPDLNNLEICEKSKVDPASEEDGSEMLVGVGGRLFEFCNDWHLGEDRNNFNAIGAGTSFALGSLYSTRHKRTPHARIKSALESAERFSSSVRGPFNILEL